MADDAYPLPGVSTITSLAQWELFFTSFATTSGVALGYLNELAGSLDTVGRNAVVATGAAFVRGFYKPISSSTSTAIPAASGQDRVDRLVLRLDRTASVAANFVKPTVLTGTAGSTVPPTLASSTTGSWDLPICRWTSAASGSLTGLVDERQFIGTADTKCTSTNRPLNPATGKLAYETDTGRWIGYTGVGWAVLATTAGWQPLTINSGFAWQGSGHHPEYLLLPNNQVRLRGLVKKTSGAAFVYGDIPCTAPSPGTGVSTWMPGGAESTSVDNSIRWQIDPSGACIVQFNTSGFTPHWVSLDGVIYDQA